MKKIVTGIVAPVDTGKTTLAENMLYLGHTIRKVGRVDHGEAFLDPETLEKRRGITITSHQAALSFHDLTLTLLDTPGHIDFAAATEQVLAVLDYAILMVPASGVNGAVQFLWQLLKRNQVPTFIFVNKMDTPGADQAYVLAQLQKLNANCIDFSGATQEMTTAVADNVAASDEAILATYLEDGKLTDDTTRQLIAQRKVFPTLFGSALHQQGVSELLAALDTWTQQQQWSDNFGARCFKISHSPQHERLSWLRITGGSLHVKDELLSGQKADQLRVYNGTKFQTVTEVPAGDVCAVTGLTTSYAGMTWGTQADTATPLVHPVMNYAVDCGNNDPEAVKKALQELTDEDPSLSVH